MVTMEKRSRAKSGASSSVGGGEASSTSDFDDLPEIWARDGGGYFFTDTGSILMVSSALVLFALSPLLLAVMLLPSLALHVVLTVAVTNKSIPRVLWGQFSGMLFSRDAPREGEETPLSAGRRSDVRLCFSQPTFSSNRESKEKDDEDGSAAFLPNLDEICPDEFAPLLALRKLVVSCSDGEEETAARLLCGRSASVAAKLRLRTGFHEVHLSQDPTREPLHVILGSDGATARLSMKASRGRISAVEVKIQDSDGGGIELQNIAGSLFNLHSSYEDAGVKRLSKHFSKTFLSGVAWWARRLESLLGFSVRLQKVTARACAADICSVAPYLQLRFSGRLMFACGKLSVPFFNLRLPRYIIPRPHAVVKSLLSKQPFVSAKVFPSRLPSEKLAHSLFSLVDSLASKVICEGFPPDANVVELQLPDGSNVEATVSPCQKGSPLEPFVMRIEAATSVACSDTRAKFSASKITVSTFRGAAPDESNRQSHVAFHGHLNLGCKGKSLIRALLKTARKRKIYDALSIQSEMHIDDASFIKGIDIKMRESHPEMLGGASFDASLRSITASGSFGSEFVLEKGATKRDIVVLPSIGVKISGNASISGDIDEGDFSLSPNVESFPLGVTIHGDPQSGIETIVKSDGGPVRVTMHKSYVGKVSLYENNAANIRLSVSLVPHVSAKLRRANGRARGSNAAASRLTTLDFKGTKVHAVVDECAVSCGDFVVAIPPRFEFQVDIENAILNVSGLGRAVAKICWLFKSSPTIESVSQMRSATLLMPDLLKGAVRAKVDIVGGVSVDAESSNWEYLSVLLNPAKHPDRIFTVLENLDVANRVLGVVDVVNAELADTLRRVQVQWKRAREALASMGISTISQVGKVIPKETMATVASRILCDSDDLRDALLKNVFDPIIDGAPFNLRFVKATLEPFLEEKLGLEDFSFELDRWARWARLILAPGKNPEPSPPPHFRARCDDDGTPPTLSANEIQRAVHDPDAAFVARAMRAAPCMRLDQVVFLCQHSKSSPWTEYQRRILHYIVAIKRRTQLVSESSSATPAQTQMISFFLGVALSIGTRPGRNTLTHSLLGPQEISILLRASLAAAVQGRSAQKNILLLLKFLERQSKFFLVGVLVELAGGDNTSVRLLTNALMSLVNANQNCIREKVNIVATLERLLGVSIPLRQDYMAGGRWPRKSYYQALASTAELVLESSARSYINWRRKLHFFHNEQRNVDDTAPNLMSAQVCIDSADAIGRQWILHAENKTLRDQAVAAYTKSFALCANVLDQNPSAFQSMLMKQYWSRNFEALMIMSVFDDVKSDVENARGWFCAQLKMTRETLSEHVDDEAWLVDKVIDSLYFEREDRERLRQDPLCRLLIANPPGKYDISIVSCMGVITEGANGTELESTFARLEEKRGVCVYRANTGTMRSLEFNANHVIDCIRTASSKSSSWCWLGYSQGCANGLKAETLLMQGFPKDRGCLKNLKGRMLLYSAANGSSHSACGDLKLLSVRILL